MTEPGFPSDVVSLSYVSVGVVACVTWALWMSREEPVSGKIAEEAAARQQGAAMAAQVQRGGARIDLLDLKARMVKIVGPTKESQYSSLLASFFQLKLSKADLDRLVPSTIGKENLLLHNNFVRAILHNVVCGEAPPPPPASFSSDISKPSKGVRRKPSSALPGADDGPTVSAAIQGGRSNGDPGFTISPRKGRSVIRDRKGAERPSPLGSHRADASAVMDDDSSRAMENGHAPDLLRPLQSSQQSAEQPETWHGSHPAKRARYEEDHVQDGKVEGDGAGADGDHDDEEEDDGKTIWLASSDVTVPLGIPFCRPSAGGARMAPAVPMPPGPVTLSMLGYASDDDESMESFLPSVDIIRQRIQMGACLEHGLDNCNADSVHIIRAALEIYLQRIMQTTVEHSQMKRSREGLGKDSGGASGPADGAAGMQHEGGFAPRERVASGWNPPAGGEKEDEQALATIPPLDFYVAMDLNHSKLGANWALLLEKISTLVFWDQ